MSRVGDREGTLSGGAGRDHRAGGLIPARHPVLGAEAVAARIGHAVGPLQRPLLARHGAGGILPATHAKRLSVTPFRGLHEARIRHREGARCRPRIAGDGAGRIRPAPHTERAAVHLRHDQVVAQQAVLDGQPVQAPPVAARLDEGEAHPGLPLQARYAVHRPGGRIAGQQHALQHRAHGLQPFHGRLVEEGRHLLDVAGDEQEALAALGEPAQLATIVGGLGHGIAVGLQQLADAIEQGPAARADARHVLEDDQLGRILGEGLQHQPHAAQRQAVQGLVLVRARSPLGKQAREALAGRRQEHDVRVLAAGGGADVGRGRLTPAGPRLAAVEVAVLVAIEEIEHRALDAGETVEVADRGGIDVDATDAAEAPDHVAHTRVGAIEALGAPAQAAEQVEVPDLAHVGGAGREGEIALHAATPAHEAAGCGLRFGVFTV